MNDQAANSETETLTTPGSVVPRRPGSAAGNRAALLTVVIAASATIIFTSTHYLARAEEPAASQPATQPAGETESKATASIQTAALRTGELSQTIIAYGTLSAQPGEVQVFSVPFESRVKKIAVSAGQESTKDLLLMEVEPSPDTKMQLLEAKNTVESATRDLQGAQQRADLKLATNQDLYTAQQALAVAKLRLSNLEQRGAAEDSHKILATVVGLVSKIDVQEGQIVQAGAPLIETVGRDRMEARIGVEPTEVAHLHVDQPVKLLDVTNAPAEGVSGKIRLITQRVNPDSRLVDVFVTPDNHDGLLLEDGIRAELITEKKETLIAPRSAVLPDDDGVTLFTVKDGKAVKHTVKIGLRNDTDVEVIGEGLAAGDIAVTLGSLELEDGMAVAVEKP